MVNGKYFFDQPIKNDLITYENIRKMIDCTTGCLLDYNYFKSYYIINVSLYNILLLILLLLSNDVTFD